MISLERLIKKSKEIRVLQVRQTRK